MNVTRNLVRTFATSGSGVLQAQKAEIPKGYHELRKIQEQFQVKDGKPVFLKKGASDQIMYRATMALTMVGLGGILKLLYDLSVPKTE